MSRKIPETITEEELIKVLDKTDNPKHKLAFMLGFYEGMRVSEIVGLRPLISRCCNSEVIKPRERVSDDKENSKKLIVYRCAKCNSILEPLGRQTKRANEGWAIEPLTSSNIDLNRRLILIKQAKGNKDRHIPIAPEVLRGLKHLPIDCCARTLEIEFKNKCKSILNKDVHFHCLRHSSMTHYLTVKKWDTTLVQQLAGHSRIQTTQLYLHVNPEHLVDKMWEGNK